MPNGRDPEGSKRLQIVVTEQEHYKIKLEATKAGMNVKQYIFEQLGIPYPDKKHRTPRK